MTRLLLAVAAISAALTSVAGAQSAFPTRIALPNGFQPEGIAIAGEQFYVGSIPTGAVYRGSLRTGMGAVLVPAVAGRAAIGMKVDRGRLFVAGGSTGNAYVYNAKTGALITSYSFAGGFVNDVVVTKRAAWFTDSSKPVLYRVPLGPGGRPGAADVVHQRQFERRLQPGFGLQRQRHRRHQEREDARLRPVELGEAVHHRRERCRPSDHTRRRRERRERRRDPPRRARRCTSSRTPWTWSRRSRSPRISGADESSGASPIRRTSTSRRRSRSREAASTP